MDQKLQISIKTCSSVFNISFISGHCRSSSTILSYEVNVMPRFNFPAIFLERIIRSDLPVNLQALACRAERSLKGNKEIEFTENSLDRRSKVVDNSVHTNADGVLSEQDNVSSGQFKEGLAVSSFGPLTPSSSGFNSKWGVYGKVCRLDKHRMVDEVHLRRFDGLLVTLLILNCSNLAFPLIANFFHSNY